MHKSWGNAIEFNEGADKIGVDVMRWMYCRQDMAENLLFGYKKADEVRRQFYLMIWNVYKFFVEYSNLDKFEVESLKIEQNSKLENILDQWILSRFGFLLNYVKERLMSYNVKEAALEIEKFVSDFSTWYIRRSRDRVWTNSDNTKDKQAFYKTSYQILVNLSILISPFLPFVSEEIYTNLTGKESVHLAFWPNIDEKIDQGLLNKMVTVRQVVEAGHRARKEAKLKVRQPLSSVTVYLSKGLDDNLCDLIAAELNVKKVILTVDKNEEIKVELDTKITPELAQEGDLRGLIRQIQEERKRLAARPDQKINLIIPSKFKKFEALVFKKVLCKKISCGTALRIEL